MMLFYQQEMLPVFNILEQHFDVYYYYTLVYLASCPTCSSKATNITLIYPVVWSITTFVTVPIAPFVNPSVTSIFILIITLALIFTS